MAKPRTGKRPLTLWLIDNRKRLGWKPADVARRAGVAETTVRGWEAGRAIGSDSVNALEVAFGVEAPRDAVDGAELGALIEALTAQTETINGLAQMIGASIVSQKESTDVLLRAMAAVLDIRLPAETRAGSEREARVGTAR